MSDVGLLSHDGVVDDIDCHAVLMYHNGEAVIVKHKLFNLKNQNEVIVLVISINMINNT